MQFDAQSALAEIYELNAKVLKAAETMTEIEEVDVGTAPQDLVFEFERVSQHVLDPRPVQGAILAPILSAPPLVVGEP